MKDATERKTKTTKSSSLKFANFKYPRDLIDLYGQPTYLDNTGSDKTNFEWEMETDDGRVFSIYDWKEYRPISKDEVIEFHIGGNSISHTLDAQNELLEMISNRLK